MKKGANMKARTLSFGDVGDLSDDESSSPNRGLSIDTDNLDRVPSPQGSPLTGSGKFANLISKHKIGEKKKKKVPARTMTASDLHAMAPYHLLTSLQRKHPLMDEFSVDWNYGILNNLSSTQLTDLLWELDWPKIEKSKRQQLTQTAVVRKFNDEKTQHLNGIYRYVVEFPHHSVQEGRLGDFRR